MKKKLMRFFKNREDQVPYDSEPVSLGSDYQEDHDTVEYITQVLTLYPNGKVDFINLDPNGGGK